MQIVRYASTELIISLKCPSFPKQCLKPRFFRPLIFFHNINSLSKLQFNLTQIKIKSQRKRNGKNKIK